MPLRPYPRATPLAAWPERDRAAWTRAAASAPRFLARGSAAPARRWSPRRRATALVDAGRFVSWLAGPPLGEPPTDAAGLAALATPGHLAAFAEREQARGLKLTSIATALGNVIGVARSLDPGRDWRPAYAVLDAIRSDARRVRPEPRHLVHPAELYALGLSLMEGTLDAAGVVTDVDAWQDGLIVALLTAAPMRIANFAALRLGEHLRREGDGWCIALGEDETKTHEADAWPVPERLAPYLAHHLEAVRPVMLARAPTAAEDTGALWLGAFGQPLGHQGIRKRITARTAAAFGEPVLPHGFRHCAATAFALEHPERPRDAVALLGHAGPRTTERHYVLSRRHLALAEVQRIIARRLRATDRANGPGSGA